MAPHRIFLLPFSLSPQIASQEESAAETSSPQVGEATSHRRVRSWGHSLQFLSSRFWGVYGSVGGGEIFVVVELFHGGCLQLGYFAHVPDLKLGAKKHFLEIQGMC